MELLFTNKQLKVRTDVYAVADGELFCKHFNSAGDVFEFILEDSERLRELLRTCSIRQAKIKRRDYLGGVVMETFRIKLDNRALARIILEEALGESISAVYLKAEGLPKDYRVANLTKHLKEINFSEDALANRELLINRTLRATPVENYSKRMNSKYSNILSSAVRQNNRKKSKLDEKMVDDIRELYRGGATQPAIGAMYGLSRTAIADILLYRTWNEHEVVAEDIEVADVTSLPVVPYQRYEDDATHLKLNPAITMFVCDGFIYKFQQNVDFQVYLGKYLPTGKYVSDAHLTFLDKIDGRNKHRNYVVSYTRGDKISNYYMSNYDVYSIIKSYAAYVKVKDS